RNRALGHLGRARARLLLRLSRRLLRHDARLRRLRADPTRANDACCAGGSLMFAQEFMRNALVAGSFIGVACGIVGYFVVLRAQVFAGDALSHVAFTGALAAAVFGLDILAGLFIACVLGGIVMGV